MNVYAPQLLKSILGGRSGSKGEGGISNAASPFANLTDTNGQERDGFSIQANLMEFLDPTAGMDESEKSAYLDRIMQKLKSGKKLSPEEMNYLRAKDPQLYLQAARVQAMRENLKSQMENCTSKEGVENAYSAATSMIAKEDPMKEALIAAYDDVKNEFKKSGKYNALPNTEEDAKKKRSNGMKQDQPQFGKAKNMKDQGMKHMEESF